MAAERKPMDSTFGGNVIPIRSRFDAVRWGDQWQAHAEKMEMLRDLAQVRADMSEALLADALAELERVKGLLK